MSSHHIAGERHFGLFEDCRLCHPKCKGPDAETVNEDTLPGIAAKNPCFLHTTRDVSCFECRNPSLEDRKRAAEEWLASLSLPEPVIATRPSETGVKHDTDKPLWNLLPFGPVTDVVEVLTYGAKKYSADNWKRVVSPRERYFAAAMRHLTAWWCGERLDPESNLPHLAHATTCLLFLAAFDNEKGSK